MRLFIPVDNPPARQIVGRHLHRHLVARQNPDVVHPHFAGDRREDNMTVFQPNFEVRIGKRFRHFPILFNQVLFRHKSPFKFWAAKF